MLSFMIYCFAVLGAAIALFCTYVALHEVLRATRQSLRIGHAILRGQENAPRRCTFAQWWSLFKSEFLSSYTDVVVGPYRLPHNPSHPALPRFHYND